MMAVNVYHACIVGIFTTRLRRLFVCGPRRAKNNSSCAAFRCAMVRERDRAPQIRTTGVLQHKGRYRTGCSFTWQILYRNIIR